MYYENFKKILKKRKYATNYYKLFASIMLIEKF